jgi:phosphatidylserine/phosphatidylglycerophosphate/cardiolipin synthase-like enzyme
LINSATESIWIQNQYLDDTEIIWLLERKNNLDIRINLPKDEKNTSKPSSLLSNSIKLLSSPRIHSKALLIDHRFLVISSINLSSNSMDHNREIGIIITDSHLINKFMKQFESDRSRSK